VSSSSPTIRLSAAGLAAGAAMGLSDVVGAVITPDLASRGAGFFLAGTALWCLAGWVLACLAGIYVLSLGALHARVVPAPERRSALAGRLLEALMLALPPSLLLALPVSTLFEGRRVASTLVGWLGPSLVTLALFLLFLVWGLLHRWAEGNPAIRALLAAGLATAAVALRVADSILLPGLYLAFHDLATVLCLACLLGGALQLLPRPRRCPSPGREVPRLAALAPPVLLLFLLIARFSLLDNQDRRYAWRLPAAVERLARNVRGIADLDGDGVSPLFGGGDCDDLAAHIHPFKRDLPGNGIDEDCNGEDATPAQSRAAAAAWLSSAGEPVRLTGDALPAAAAAADNVLLISVDALRYDHAFGDSGAPLLGCLGELTDGLTVFRRAFAPATSTQLSVPAMLTSRHRFWEAKGSLARDFVAGHATTLLLTHRAFVEQLARPLGREQYPAYPLADRFQRTILVGGPPRAGEWGMGAHRFTAEELTDRALAAWRETSGRKLVWVHYFDLHQWNHLDQFRRAGSPKARYGLVLARIDEAVRRLVTALEAMGDLDSTLVIFFADHGEGLGDRNIQYHTKLVYNVLARVPLALHVPGGRSRVVDEPVSLLDLRPTLQVLSQGRRCPDCRGHSLHGFLSSSPPSWDHPLLISDFYQQAVISGGYKLVFDRFSHTVELYALAADPLEDHSLVEAKPDVTARLLLLLKAHPHYLEPGGRAVR